MKITWSTDTNDPGMLVAEGPAGDGGYSPESIVTKTSTYDSAAGKWVPITGHPWFFFPDGDSFAHDGIAPTADAARDTVEGLLTGRLAFTDA